MDSQTPAGHRSRPGDRLERASAGFFSGVITADAELARKFSGARLVTIVRNFPLASFGRDYLDAGKSSGTSGRNLWLFMWESWERNEVWRRSWKLCPWCGKNSRSPLPAGGRVSFMGLSPVSREKLKELEEEG